MPDEGRMTLDLAVDLDFAFAQPCVELTRCRADSTRVLDAIQDEDAGKGEHDETGERLTGSLCLRCDDLRREPGEQQTGPGGRRHPKRDAGQT